MAEIIFSSSFDDVHPAENILNPDKKRYWSTTGLFPQELFIQLQTEKILNSLSFSSYGIKKVLIESCENDSAVNFIKQGEVSDIQNKEGKMQEFSVNFSQPKQTKLLKVTILEGYEDFCTVHYINFK